MLGRVGRKLLAGILLAVALAAGLWLARRETHPAPELPVSVQQTPAAAQRAAVEPLSRSEAAREELHEVAAKEAEPAAPPSGIALTLRFVGPDRGALQPARASVRLTGPAGQELTRVSEDAPTLLFPGLAPVRYVAEVRAPGFTHRAEELDLSGHDPAEQGLSESLVLWPENWVAVVVLAQDGRPLRTLADELGIEPKRLFVDAFVARGAGAFHKPPVYQQWQLSESVVGALFLSESPPLWVELLFHGQPVGQEPLATGQTEVVFRLSIAELETGLALLRLRVLEPQGDKPVAGANVTLRADNSAHRRKDQDRVPTRDDGSVEFARVVPGRYELVVQHGEAQYQERLDLAPGERRDLGLVRVGSSVPLRVRVVDERGEPVRAWLEIGPFEAGKNVHDLYPPMLHETTDAQGKGRLAMPTRAAIVRAQRMDAQSLHATGQCSANVRLDPAHAPAGELELVILDEARVRLLCRQPEARTLRLLDESGLIVLEEPTDSKRWKEGRRELEFGRGRYDLRLCGVAGEVLYERAVELHAGEQELELP
jgi:hypothetical protein